MFIFWGRNYSFYMQEFPCYFVESIQLAIELQIIGISSCHLLMELNNVTAQKAIKEEKP